MLGNRIRTRVAQEGVMSSSTVVNLFGSAALTAHKTFEQGFNKTAGSYSEHFIPVLIEKADGTWQTGTGSLTGDVGVTCIFTLVTLHESSNADNSAITLTAADPVTIHLSPIAALFQNMRITPTSAAPVLVDPSYSPSLMAGQQTVAAGKHSVAAGYRNANYGYGAQTFGVETENHLHAALHLGCGKEWSAFGADLVHTAMAVVAARHQRTTNATPAELTYLQDDNTTQGAADMLCDAGITHWVAIVSAHSDAGVRRVWRLEWMIYTDPLYSGTALMGTVAKTNLFNGDGGAAAWDVDVSVDSFANTCAIEVTGAAATNILWAARIDAFVNSAWDNS